MKQKLVFLALMILCVGFVFSQETGKFGFFFKAGSYESVGLTWNLSDRVTLRPSFGFYTTKTGWENVASEEDKKENGYSMELGLFYHFLKKNHFTAYSGLEMGYTRQTGDITTCSSGSCGTYEGTDNGYMGNLILGFQYNFNKHLAVFGEIGFGFLKQKLDYVGLLENQVSYKLTSWSLERSGFGIILYL